MAKEQTATSSFLNKIATYRQKPLVKDTISTTILSTIGKGFGFLIPFFLAAWYGISKETDVFFFVYGLIIFFANILAPTLQSVIVPFIAEKRANGQNAAVFTSQMLVASFFISLAFMFIFLVFIPRLVLLVTNFSLLERKLLRPLLTQTSPLLLLIILNSVLTGTLNAYRYFTFPALYPGIRANIALVVIYLLKDILNINAVVYGYIAGELTVFLWLLAIAFKRQLITLALKLSLNEVGPFFKTAFYQSLGMSLAGLAPVIDKTMATWLTTGSVSILEYAQRLYLIPLNFFSMGFLVVLLSDLSEKYYQTEPDYFFARVFSFVRYAFFISLITVIASLVLSWPLVSVLYGYGRFTFSQRYLVWLATTFYFLGLTTYLVRSIFVRALITLKKTKILLASASLIIVLDIFTNLIFIKLLGVTGIALATTVTELFATIYLWYSVSNQRQLAVTLAEQS